MALMKREDRVATRGRAMSRCSRRFSLNVPTWENEIQERSGSIPPVPQLPSHSPAGFPAQQRPVGTRRWDGNQRITTDWDALRRDPELWFGDGDCLVHLYGSGRSRRGPSLCITLAEIEARGCGPLLEIRSSPPSPRSSHSHSSSESSIESFTSIPSNDSVEGARQLYLPAPSKLSKDEAFEYNLTTRNFFAWMFGKPLVGSLLGQALIALFERMNLYRADERRNEEELLAYMERQGYTDFRECADHALAALQFAERFQIEELWGDAFAHCTGMNISLPASAEFEHVSHISRTLITRAYLEMDLRLERAGHSLSSFFEDDLSGSYLGLGNAARSHLDSFRSFLHAYYVGSYGYWPPARSMIKNLAFPKSLYLSMYFEFRDLYLYLVDTESTTSIQDNKIASGGLCVLQNVRAFDRRHRYKSLPHPLPISPELPRETKANSFSASAARRLGIGSRQTEFNKRVGIVRSLANASNNKIDLITCPLVRDYMLFERTCTLEDEEKVSPTDGRKVRWMLIYAIFQTLISVTQAPKQVKDTQDVSYSLCCQIPATAPWKIGVFNIEERQMEHGSTTKFDIQPDINYAANISTHSLASSKSFGAQSKRSSSPHSMRRMISRAKVPTNQPTVPKRATFHEIIVHGYGNGWNPTQISDDAANRTTMSEPSRAVEAPKRAAAYCAIMIPGYGNGLHQTDTNPAEEPQVEVPSPISAPSTPTSSRDSSRWSNVNYYSSDESVSGDMEHLSLDVGDKTRLSSFSQPSEMSGTSVKDFGLGLGQKPDAELSPPLEV